MRLYHFTSLERLVGAYGFAAIGRALDDSESVQPQDFAEPGSILRAGLRPLAVSASAMVYDWLQPCVWLTANPGQVYAGDRYGWRITVEIEPRDSRLASRNDLLRRTKPKLFGDLPAPDIRRGASSFWVYFGTIPPQRFRAVEDIGEKASAAGERADAAPAE